MFPPSLRDEFFGSLTQQSVANIARDAFASNLEHDRHRKRRNVTQLTMPDSPADPLQELSQAAEIDQARRGVGERCLEQHVVGLVLTQDIVDEIG